jgi:HEPN domain-containing protein
VSLGDQRRRFQQAVKQVKRASELAHSGNFEGACWQSHHAAFLALDSVLYRYLEDSPSRSYAGQSLVTHIEELGRHGWDLEHLEEDARQLDFFYLESPRINKTVSPFYFSDSDAERRISMADCILETVRNLLYD